MIKDRNYRLDEDKLLKAKKMLWEKTLNKALVRILDFYLKDNK